MSDLSLSVALGRSQLGLPDLECNDNTTYRIAKMLGGSVAWARTQVESQYVDGAVTTARHKQMVTETVEVDVLDQPDFDGLQLAMTALIAAFTQDSFLLTISLSGTIWRYACEAADVQPTWTIERLISHRGYLAAQVPRQPNALVGGF